MRWLVAAALVVQAVELMCGSCVHASSSCNNLGFACPSLDSISECQQFYSQCTPALIARVIMHLIAAVTKSSKGDMKLFPQQVQVVIY